MMHQRLTTPLYNLPTNVHNAAKLIVPPLATGIKNAVIGFSLISVPTFISYFGSDSHKLAKGEEGIVPVFSKALMSMNLAFGVGQALSPVLCGSYEEPCKVLARIGGYAVQTWMFNQTAASGIAKGISYELLGFNYKSSIVSEAIGTISNPFFVATYNNDFSKINTTEITNNLYRDEIITHHVYAAVSCLYRPIVMHETLHPLDTFLYGYLLADFNVSAVYETTSNLIEDAKAYFLGEDSQHDEF